MPAARSARYRREERGPRRTAPGAGGLADWLAKDGQLLGENASRPTSVVGIVEHRAAQMRPDVRHLAQAIGGRLRAALDETDDFRRIHIGPVDGHHVRYRAVKTFTSLI